MISYHNRYMIRINKLINKWMIILIYLTNKLKIMERKGNFNIMIKNRYNCLIRKYNIISKFIIILIYLNKKSQR
jgi:hypothetical protein